MDRRKSVTIPVFKSHKQTDNTLLQIEQTKYIYIVKLSSFPPSRVLFLPGKQFAENDGIIVLLFAD